MASHRIPQYFLNPRLSLWSVAVVFTLMWHLSVSDLKGEVGGSVTFHCPVDKHKQKRITLFYLKKGLEFVNGYYVSKKDLKGWENTKLDLINTNVNIYNLSVSHSGVYHCQIMYDHDDLIESPIHLSVTANYSKPEVTKNCNGLHCLVRCSSHGGYPSRKIEWNVTGIQIWKIVNSNETSDPVTMLVNSSSTASFNCSKGKLQFSCSVDNVTGSDSFSVCTTEDPQALPCVLAAICGGVLCIIILVVVLSWRYKRRQGSAPVNGGPECGVQGCPEEDMPLKGKEGEVER